MGSSTVTRLVTSSLATLIAVLCGGQAAATDMYVQPSGVGIGTASPQRMLHLAGPTALFRMDRTEDAAAFLIVRTTPGGTPLKSFVVGTMASGPNNGQFVINDLGTAVGGAGARRMTVENNGNVTFTGSVAAAGFIQPSSIYLKTNINVIADPISSLNQVRGVRFNWKASGKPALGLIAEEVQAVFPEVVEINPTNGQVAGVDYSGLVGVLVEAVKSQQKTIEAQGMAIQALQQQISQIETAGR